MYSRRILLTLLLCGVATACQARPDLNARSDVNAFISEMTQRHGFARTELESLFREVELRPDIIEAITRPAESKPWHVYRPIFLTKDRIRDGVQFWKDNEAALNSAQVRYGVSPQYIVAIVGVETRYGRFSGRHRVMDALSTLAFDYPPRGDFFRRELEQYLLMTREEGIPPLKLTGSYAGAMGKPQFIPSSFRNFAVDFDGDGKRDLWDDNLDVIGSVANYFKVHGWQSDAPVAMPALAHGERLQTLLDIGLKPQTKAAELGTFGVTPQSKLPAETPVALLQLEASDGPEHWVTFNNFYVITRYNRSPLYAMAVHQLSEEIRKAREEHKPFFPFE